MSWKLCHENYNLGTKAKLYNYIKMKNYLNFETDIKNLENELEKLKDPFNQEGLSEVDTKKISKTQEEIDEKLKDIYNI